MVRYVRKSVSHKEYARIRRKAGPFVTPQKGPELKFNDAVISSNVGYDDTPLCINAIAAGDDSTQRAARTIRMKHLILRGNVDAGTLAAQPCNCRILVVYDKTPKGGLPTAATVFQNGWTGHVDTSSEINLDLAQRFLILYDKVWTVEAYSSEKGSLKVFDEFVPLKGLITRWTNTGAAIANMSAGALLLFTLGDGVAGTSTQPTVACIARTRFTDG